MATSPMTTGIPIRSTEVRRCTLPAPADHCRNRGRVATVVVAAGDHHLGTGVHQSQQGIGEQPHRVRRRGPGRRRRLVTRTASMRSAWTTSTRWSRKRLWAPSNPAPWNDRPRCQSEVQQPHDRNARSRHRQRPGPKRGLAFAGRRLVIISATWVPRSTRRATHARNAMLPREGAPEPDVSGTHAHGEFVRVRQADDRPGSS